MSRTGDGDGHDAEAAAPEPSAPPAEPLASAPPDPSIDPSIVSSDAAVAPWPAAPEPAADEPLVPASYDDDALRVAVGVAPSRSSDDDDDGDDGDGDGDGEGDRADGSRAPRRNRKAMMVAAVSLVVGSAIAAIVVLGKINGERYRITCEADRVVVEQGRSFPPWGENALDGAEWKPLPIPPEAPCTPRETTDRRELSSWFLHMLTTNATTLLTAREVTKVDDAEAQLKQALLVSRGLASEDDRVNLRNEIERLLGDVAYWRASARLRAASDALTDAAKQFDAAAAQRPRHVTDAAAWAVHVRGLVESLRLGPGGVSPAFPPLPPDPSERPIAPVGVALPVEPGDGSGSVTAEPDAAPPPAAPPSGGVLL